MENEIDPWKRRLLKRNRNISKAKYERSSKERSAWRKKFKATRERNILMRGNISGDKAGDDNSEIREEEVEEVNEMVQETPVVVFDCAEQGYFSIEVNDDQNGLSNLYDRGQADGEEVEDEDVDEEEEDEDAALGDMGLIGGGGVDDEEDDELEINEGDVIMDGAALNDDEDDREFQPDPEDPYGYDQMSIVDLYKLLPKFLNRFPGFDISVYSSQAAKQAIYGYALPADDDEPLWQQHVSLKKGNFYRSLNRMFTKHKVGESGQKQFLDMFQHYIPDINFPIAKHLSLYDRFQENDYFKFHICIKGCMVYEGDYKDKYVCDHCNLDRLRKCRQCQASGYCQHKDRIPRAVVRYRSLVGLLIRLIARYPKFVDLLDYVNESHFYDELWISDLANAERYRTHVNEMQQSYQTKVEQKQLSPSTKSVCLLLGQFYDGAQIFKTKVVSFWPIFIQILSLPPHLRTQIGIGFFVLTLIALSSFSDAVEKFILQDCLVSELKLLNKGYLFTHNGRHYFLQARLVLHALDTKGMEPLLKAQATNAKAGCPLCSLERAVYRTQIKKACIVEHRRHLPPNHLLRSIGQSQRCCPADYYRSSNVEQVEVVNDHKPRCAVVTLKATVRSFNNDLCSDAERFNAGEFLWKVYHGYDSFVWYHDEKTVDPDDALKIFRSGLYYPHCNYADQLRHQRRKNIEYLRSGLYVYSIREDKRFYKKHQEAVNGIKGIWPFALLEYATLEDVSWDPFHILKNIMLNIIANFKGERLQKYGTTGVFCALQQCHPSMYTTDIAHPWELDQNIQDKIDSFIACLIFPYGCGEEKDMLYPFARTGMMKGHGMVQLLSNFMDYMLLAIGDVIPTAYRRFLSMLSYDVSQILNPVVKSSDIETLYNQVLETICVKEGLYPESEALFPYHQLTDVAKFIRFFGPVRGWWTFAGERAIGVLKRFVPQGGTSYDQTTFNRYLKAESLKTSQYYKTGHDILAEGAEEDEEDEEDERFLRKTADGKYVFNAFPNILHKPVEQHEQYDISVFDLAQIIACWMNEIELHSSNISIARKDSPLYYLTTFYRKHINITATLQSFIEWIKDGSFLTWQIHNEEKVLEVSIYAASLEQVTQSWESGFMYSECQRIAKDLINLQVCMYQHATILGVKFKSRGWQYREKNSPIEEERYGRDADILPSNEANILINHWSELKSYSSWCAMKVSPPYTNKDLLSRSVNSIKFGEHAMNSRVYQYGQLNAFLKVHMQADKFIHGMCIASVTARCYEDEDFIDTILVDDKLSFVSNRGYVPISYILPTHIALAGFAHVKARKLGRKDYPPMFLPVNIQAQGGIRDEWFLSSKWKDKVSRLVMINIDRSRGSRLKEYYDEHGGKHFEVRVKNGKSFLLKVKLKK